MCPFAQGPYCNVISAAIRFAHPIECSGSVGQWEIPPEVRVVVRQMPSQPWALQVKYNRLKQEDLPRRSPLPWLGPSPPAREESLDAEPPQRTSCTNCGSTSTSLKDIDGRQRWVMGMCKRCYAARWRDRGAKRAAEVAAAPSDERCLRRDRRVRARRCEPATAVWCTSGLCISTLLYPPIYSPSSLSSLRHLSCPCVGCCFARAHRVLFPLHVQRISLEKVRG